MNRIHLLLFSCLIILSFTACEEDSVNPIDTTYTVPETYTFENVDYSGQTARLDMLAEMTTYMKTGNSGATIDAEQLQNMYAHTEGATDFEDAALNSNSKNLRSKTFPDGGVPATFDAMIQAIATASESTVPAEMGQAGVLTSTTNPDKKYLVNENGVEFTQLIEKGLMGAVFLYQGTTVYLDDLLTDDNETVEEGKGTARAHHFDEAFGYFGIPTDWPANTDTDRFWGKYAADRDAILSNANSIMDNFILGRAAISNKDDKTLEEVIPVLQEEWEMVSAATAIHYLNSALEDFSDMALRTHVLSEAAAFTYSAVFSPTSKMSIADRDEILTLIGGSNDLLGLNFYATSREKIQSARNKVSEIYDLDAVKDNL